MVALVLSFGGCDHAPRAAAAGGTVASSRGRPIDTDPVFAERVGRAYLDQIGYDRIMRLALEARWLEASPPNTGNVLAQGAEAIGFVGVFTRYAVAAGVASQVDSPAPGPGDVAAVGILVIGLVDAALLSGAILTSITKADPITGPTAAPPIPGPITMATAAPTTTVLPMPTTLPLPDQFLWRQCNQQHQAYKKTGEEDFPIAKQIGPLHNLVFTNKASPQERVDYCLLLDKRIELTQREHKERSKYIKDDCDKFDCKGYSFRRQNLLAGGFAARVQVFGI